MKFFFDEISEGAALSSNMSFEFRMFKKKLRTRGGYLMPFSEMLSRSSLRVVSPFELRLQAVKAFLSSMRCLCSTLKALMHSCICFYLNLLNSFLLTRLMMSAV